MCEHVCACACVCDVLGDPPGVGAVCLLTGAAGAGVACPRRGSVGPALPSDLGRFRPEAHRGGGSRGEKWGPGQSSSWPPSSPRGPSGSCSRPFFGVREALGWVTLNLVSSLSAPPPQGPQGAPGKACARPSACSRLPASAGFRGCRERREGLPQPDGSRSHLGLGALPSPPASLSSLDQAQGSELHQVWG